MASRLQQFATRNQKQGIQPKTGKQSSARKADNARHSRAEPTLLDTDVESIGNTTTLSFADLDEGFDHYDAKTDPLYAGESSKAASKVKARPIHDPSLIVPQRRWPHQALGRPSTKDQADYRDEPEHHNTYESAHQQLFEEQEEEEGRLDDVSSLPDSSRDGHSQRDLSPSPAYEEDDPDITPRRTQTHDLDASASPLDKSKQFHRLRTLSGPLQPPITQPLNLSSQPQLEADLLDYSPTTLSRMPYDDLAKEPFETDPSHPAAEDATSSPTPILERIRALTDPSTNETDVDDDDAARHTRLMHLFATLTLEEYEAAGDAILEQFGAVFARFTELRRRKRAVSKDFEERVAAREGEVRERQHALDSSMGRLKREGEDFIRGGPGE